MAGSRVVIKSMLTISFLHRKGNKWSRLISQLISQVCGSLAFSSCVFILVGCTSTYYSGEKWADGKDLKIYVGPSKSELERRVMLDSKARELGKTKCAGGLYQLVNVVSVNEGWCKECRNTIEADIHCQSDKEKQITTNVSIKPSQNVITTVPTISSANKANPKGVAFDNAGVTEVTVTGRFNLRPDMSQSESCRRALENAKKDAVALFVEDKLEFDLRYDALIRDSKPFRTEIITEDGRNYFCKVTARVKVARQKKQVKARIITKDSLSPTLQVVGKYSKDAIGFIEGRVTDNVGVVELLVNGQLIAFDNDGRFTHQEYLPSGGKEFTIVAVDRAGLKTTETIRLNRETPTQVAKISFDSLNPTSRPARDNSNAIALIIGVAEYSKTAPAEFADKDAQVFYDYAHLKLGIPQNRIQVLVNDKADEVGLLTGVNKWLKRSVKQGESDVYIFFAGHGLASDDGDTAYLIPYDGAPDFLERTAISRDEVFREVSSVNPRSVTVFLDTCYSGDTRGESRLIAGRPLGIKLQEQSLPAGFTVLTAAGGDQIAKPLKEAQHGMFSYFLMKGMEGDADTNSDNQITARELHSYVRENVVQQSGGSQVPELQGDGEKVLVRFR